ncbi:MAG: metalloregulator ArsR/SmtB family transcription factor [Bacilli bacterium]|jgi:ArsR family transcriptional regulator|nr:metalloregulator ArsR/SmtB family transcription factor [Bacilli bacterium]
MEIKEQTIMNLKDFFKVLGDETRVRIILLLRKNPLNVSEIARRLNMEQSAISHQLRVLYSHRVVTYVRSGQERIYEIVDNHIYEILAQAKEHIEE